MRENLTHKIRPLETVHLKNKRQKISCKLCDIDFKRVHSLNRHNASVHEGNECSICHVTYTFRDDLIHHIRTKHDKIHECKVCSFKFGDSESLLKHIDVIHEGKRLHQCTKCGYTFRNEVRHTIFKFYSKVFLFKKIIQESKIKHKWRSTRSQFLKKLLFIFRVIHFTNSQFCVFFLLYYLGGKL